MGAGGCFSAASGHPGQARGLLPAASTAWSWEGAEGRQDGGRGVPSGRDEAAAPRQGPLSASDAAPFLPDARPASSIATCKLQGSERLAGGGKLSWPAAQPGSNNGEKRPRPRA